MTKLKGKVEERIKAIRTYPKWPLWKKVLGIILIIVGLCGIFLPFIQGLLLVGIGVYLMGNHKLIDWFKRTFNLRRWKQKFKK